LKKDLDAEAAARSSAESQIQKLKGDLDNLNNNLDKVRLRF